MNNKQCKQFETDRYIVNYQHTSIFQPHYFPALDATMDQRSLPMDYSFLGHEPDHLVRCDLPECAVRIQLNSPNEIT